MSSSSIPPPSAQSALDIPPPFESMPAHGYSEQQLFHFITDTLAGVQTEPYTNRKLLPKDPQRFAEAESLLREGNREAALRAMYEGYYGIR